MMLVISPENPVGVDGDSSDPTTGSDEGCPNGGTQKGAFARRGHENNGSKQEAAGPDNLARGKKNSCVPSELRRKR